MQPKTLTYTLLEHLFGEVGLLGYPCRASYDDMQDQIVLQLRDIKDSINREIQELRMVGATKYGTVHNYRIYVNPNDMNDYRELNVDTAIDTAMFVNFNKRLVNFQSLGYTPYLVIRDLINTTIADLLKQPAIRDIILEIVVNHRKIYGEPCYKRITASLSDNYFFNINEQVQPIV